MANGVLRVQLSADAYLVCLTHALSAEKEEVMGVLLGEVRLHSHTQTQYGIVGNVNWQVMELGTL